MDLLFEIQNTWYIYNPGLNAKKMISSNKCSYAIKKVNFNPIEVQDE